MYMPNPYEHLTCEVRIKDGTKVIAQCSATDHCIHDLDVHPDYRRRKYATRILNILRREFDADWLWVRSDNEEAVALYNNLGFKIVEIDDGYYKMKRETQSDL